VGGVVFRGIFRFKFCIVVSMLLFGATGAFATIDDAPAPPKFAPVPTIDELNQEIRSGTLTGHALADAYAQRALWQLRQKQNLQSAIDDLTHAISIAGDARYFALRGIAYMQLQDQKNALVDFAAVVRLEPNSPRGHALRAGVFASINDYQNYVVETDLIIAMSPNPLLVIEERAEFFFGKGLFERAIADYTAALKLNPAAADMLSNRGDARSGLHDYKGAMVDYDAAITMDPAGKLASYAKANRAVTLFELGRFVEAADAAEKVADADPTDAYHLLWLEYTRQRASHSDAADFARRAQSIDKTKWPAAIIDYRLGTMSENDVFADAEKATGDEKIGHVCEATFHIGLFKALGGDVALARPMIKRALEICPPGFTEYTAAFAVLQQMGS
jgi:lipoprotein NlpI